MSERSKPFAMDPTTVREDPLVQYLLGFALVVAIVGTVGGLAQTLHWGGLPSLAYIATILGLAVAFVALAAAYVRFVRSR